MAFNLSGTIIKQLITDLFIPLIQNALVSGNFVITKTDVNAESIKIWGVGTVNIDDYTGGDVSGVFHTDNEVLLTLDKAKYFKEKIENIDTKQAAINILTPVLQEGAYQIAAQIDRDVFAMLAGTTTIVPATVLDASNILSWLGSMRSTLTNKGAPVAGRRLAVSPEIAGLLAEVGYGKGSDSIATEGGREFFITRLGGFDIYESVNLVGTGVTEATIVDAGAGTFTPGTHDITQGTDFTTNGTGTGLVINVTTDATGITTVNSITTAGTGHKVGDVITVTQVNSVAFDTAAVLSITNAGVQSIGSVPRGGALGIALNDLHVEPRVSGQFYGAAMGLTNYGTKLVKDEYVVRSDTSVA